MQIDGNFIALDPAPRWIFCQKCYLSKRADFWPFNDECVECYRRDITASVGIPDRLFNVDKLRGTAMQILSQAFKLHPFSLVRGGALFYEIDQLHWLIRYEASLTYKGIFSNPTKTFEGAWQTTQSALLSSNFVPGYKAAFGPLAVVVDSVSPGRAHVALVLAGSAAYGKGVAVIDTTETYAKFAQMADGYYGRADVTVKGNELHFVLEK